jgi:ribosome-associated translation inhibitor RaiA
MIQINFQNMERSDLVKEATIERLETIIERFPDLQNSNIKANLEMLNSPLHAGPDLFRVKVQISTGRYRGIRISKSAANLYVALAEVIDCMLEKLNRFGDRTRVKSRTKARELVTKMEQSELTESNGAE